MLLGQVTASRTTVTGNTVIDALHMEVTRQRALEVQAEIQAALGTELGEDWDRVPYVLVTGHRRENFGEEFAQICQALAELADAFAGVRFVYPVHLNPNVQGSVQAALGGHENIRLIPPKGYRLSWRSCGTASWC